MSRRPLAWRALAPLAAFLVLQPPDARADGCSGLSLKPLVEAAVGTSPVAVAAGDFDRDGRLDLAVVDGGSKSLTILLGDGKGGLAKAATSPLALRDDNPIDLAVGDLDRDGFLDLVVAFGSAPEVQVWRGTAGGGFTDAGTFALGPTPMPVPTRILLGRMTGDALADLVVLYDAGQRIRVYGGSGGGFLAAPLADLDTAGDAIAGGTLVDFDRDGKLDLAVAIRNRDTLRVYLGDGTGRLSTTPGLSLAVGKAPVDVAAGDLDRDGWLDLVTANSADGTLSVGQSSTKGTELKAAGTVAAGTVPTRVALVDLDHDGLLDLSALDEAGRLDSFLGQKTAPFFDPLDYPTALPGTPRGLAVGPFSADGRDDLATAVIDRNTAVVIENQSGMPCARSSFAAAPRSYPAGDGPAASAAGDLDHDGRADLVVVSANDKTLRVLQNVGGGFGGASVVTLPLAPRGVAVADMNADGNLDAVVTLGAPGSGIVQVYLGDGGGSLALASSQAAGNNLAGVVVGDVNGDGAPDVAAASEGSNQVLVLLGNGLGGIGPATAVPVGAAPHALVAAFLDQNATLDLAVANSGGNSVAVLSGAGNGSFSALATLAVGGSPIGIAAADLDADGQQDLVTADNGASQVSVLLRNAGGGFRPAVPYGVGAGPAALALVDLEGDTKPDIAVASFGSESLTLLTNDGGGAFPGKSDHTLRTSPQAVTPIDADSDGLLDLAIPCRSADAVVVLMTRPPGPPSLQSAPTVAVRKAPRAAAAGDWDGDGVLDLAVANSADGSVSLLRGDGLGGFTEYAVKGGLTAPEAIVTGDWNGDGRLDLAVSAAGSGDVLVFLGSSVAPGDFAGPTKLSVGGSPDDLVAGDFDGDGDLDLAVCDKVVNGAVNLLRNDGAGSFSAAQRIPVGDKPTATVAGDFDRDGDLDLAVANDDSDNLVVLRNSGGSFDQAQTLPLPAGDKSPVSLATGDFDGDGTLDLVAAAGDSDHLLAYRNLGGTFSATPASFAVPYVVRFVTSADMNRDGLTDLVAVADGLSFFSGKGALDFDTPQTVVARYTPSLAVVGDFDRDGRPDVAVLDEGSNEVSILTSTTCRQQHLEVSLQPNACSTGAPPFAFDAAVTAFDDGGNVAACAAGSVGRAIVPGTGDPTAALGGPASLAFASGVAAFSGVNGLTLDKPGRYKLQFSTPAAPPVETRSFTLGSTLPLQILGPDSVCPGSPATYTLNQSFDSYAWTLTPTGPPPFAYTKAAVLSGPPLAGSYQLDVLGRNECASTASRSLFFGSLAEVSLTTIGVSSVCVDCIGGAAKAVELGGGAIVSRQWGYRTVSSTGPVTSLSGETADTYALKGASFPGPGTYYVVVTSAPSCGPALVSANEWPVTIVADVPTGEVRHLAASSRGTSAGGENQLLWVNTVGSADEWRVRWNQAPAGTTSCLPPASVSAPASGEASKLNPLGGKDGHLHTPVLLDTAYCYSVFVRVSGAWSAGRTVTARAFDATSRPGHSVKWAYATGGTAVAPPSVSGPAVLAMSNDRTVHALTRGSAGGLWPPSWVPTELNGVAHARSPVVSFTTPLNGADTVLFAADDSAPGFLHAIDARTGVRPWPAQPQGLAMTGAPGGMFTQFGGLLDALFVGTRSTTLDNALRALRLSDGSLAATYAPAGPPGPLGPINGSPAIDYATRRLYFAAWSRAGGDTLFCLQIDAGPALAHVWSRNLGNISGSPVVRGGRLYVGTVAGVVYSLDAMTGGDDHTLVTADGAVKGFLFPDRRNDDVLFATDTKVWSLSDGAASLSVNWTFTLGGFNPSVVLYWPGTSFVYVGSRNGELYELDFSAATLATPPTFKLQVLGGGLGQVGAPSLDVAVAPQLLLVGSEPGVVYGVEVPFP